VLCIAAAGCERERPNLPVGNRIASVVALYTPQVGLGRPVSETLVTLPGVSPADYAGYKSPHYRSIDGFGELLINVEEAEHWAGSEGDRPPPYYRVSSIVVFAADLASASQAEARLTRLLGPAEERCWRESWGGLNRLLYWADPIGGGVRLIVPFGPWKYRDRDVDGEWIQDRRASLTMTLDYMPGLREVYLTCAQAPQPEPWRFSFAAGA